MSQNTPGSPFANPRRGEVYWVSVPETRVEGSEHHDTIGGSPHAYVIVSRDSFNERSKAFIGVPFTSRLQKANRTYRP